MSSVADLRSRDADVWRSTQREFRGPVVVEAGAGTGKTTLLVARCVAWALAPGWERAQRRLGSAGPERIAAELLARLVALTFTEAAAAEMAKRIGLAFARLAEGELPAWLDAGALPEPPVRRERAEALRGALDRFQVRTIHAYCRRLLAQHALAAGLHPQLEVDADGRSARAIAREIVEAAVRAGYAEDGDPDLLELGVQGSGPPELEEALAALLARGVDEAALAADPFAPERVRAWAGEISARLHAFEAAAGGRLAKTLRARLTGETLDALAASAKLLAGCGAGVAELERVAQQLRQTWPENLVKRLRDWSRGRFNASELGALGEAEGAAAHAAAELRPALEHALGLEPARLEVTRRVLGALLARARQRMRSLGILSFDGLLRGARDLLRDHPAVRASVRAELDQLLVDEFQDTDQLQCEILRWLALDGPEQERPLLFLVGDPKQSIYGWREADLRAYELFSSEALGPGREPQRLFVNRRSTPAVLAEVARTIAPVMREQAGLQPAFQPLVASAEREQQACELRGGGAEHWITWEWDAEASAIRRPRAQAAAQVEARAIARDLLRLRREESLAWRDAGVLLRARGDLEIYLRALREAGIPYAVERDRSYYRRREVIDATALVCCVLDPRDPLALLAWLRSPSVGVPDAALLPLWSAGLPARVAELEGDVREPLAELGKQIEAVAAALPGDIPGLDRIAGWEQALRHALATLAVLRASFASDAADLFVEKLRDLTLIEATEAARHLGAYRLANLERFFRELRAELEAEEVDVQALLRRLRGDVANARSAEDARPPDDGEEAVRVMTIHQAKGLEFRHCYLAQVHKRRRISPGELPLELRELDGWPEYRVCGVATLGFSRVRALEAAISGAEQVRSLYVAMTRACDRLVLLGNRDPGWELEEPGSATAYAGLLAARSGARPDLAAEMASARREARDGLLDAEGVRWVFPALRDQAPLAAETEGEAATLPSVAALREEALALAGLREQAARRMRRAFRAAASADAQADAQEETGPGRFGGPAAAGFAPLGNAQGEAARAAGTAVHRVLEALPLGGDLRAALEQERGRLVTTVERLAAPEARAEALELARAALARLADGALLARLEQLGGAVIARELPLLIPADPEGEGPVGFVSGAIDLLYQDPATGEIVIADYKTDRVEAGDALAEHARRYQGQAAHYRRGIQQAFALAQPPRFELWFLHADAVQRLG